MPGKEKCEMRTRRLLRVVMFVLIASVFTPMDKGAGDGVSIKALTGKETGLNEQSTIVSYLKRYHTPAAVENCRITTGKNFLRFRSDDELIKVYPNSGLILFEKRGQKYALSEQEANTVNAQHTDNDLDTRTNTYVETALNFMHTNLHVQSYPDDEIIVDGIQVVRGKTMNLETGNEQLRTGNVIVTLRRTVNNTRIVGDGNFANIFLNPETNEIVAWEFQWDELDGVSNSPTLEKELTGEASNLLERELVYISANRYARTRAFVPAYIGVSPSNNRQEVRNAITGSLLESRDIE